MHSTVDCERSVFVRSFVRPSVRRLQSTTTHCLVVRPSVRPFVPTSKLEIASCVHVCLTESSSFSGSIYHNAIDAEVHAKNDLT